MICILPDPPMLLLPTDNARKKPRMSGIIPKESEIRLSILEWEFGSDPGLDVREAGVTPSSCSLGGAVTGVVGVVLLFSSEVRAPLCIQTVKREDANLLKQQQRSIRQPGWTSVFLTNGDFLLCPECYI